LGVAHVGNAADDHIPRTEQVGEWVRVEPEITTLTDGTLGYNPVQVGEERWVGRTELENIGVIERPVGVMPGFMAASAGLPMLYANRGRSRSV
jgi:hypothetical protein